MVSSLLISSVGEFGLLQFIKKWCKFKKDINIISSIGDDAFIYKLSSQKYLALTKDVLIEDIHFKLSWYTSKRIPPSQLGYKALAVNIADLLSKGITDIKFCLVGFAAPPNLEVKFVKNFYRGLKKLADKFGIKIVGGDTSASKKITISITLMGFSSKPPILRSTAKVNDYIALTGKLGQSSAGLKKLLSGNYKLDDGLIRSHLYPPIRMNEAKKIVKYSLANSMIDCSDGLYPSIKFICEESKKGAIIYLEKIPVSEELKKYTKNKNLYDYILYGGEDYELIFTIPKEKMDLLKRVLPAARVIGMIANKNFGIRFFHQGERYEVKNEGYQHFVKKR